jgi:hypothetical protein
VRREVLESVESLAHEAEGLVLVGVVAALLEAASEFDASEKSTADETLGGVPVAVF